MKTTNGVKLVTSDKLKIEIPYGISKNIFIKFGIN